VGQRNVFRAVQKVAQLTPYTFLLTLGDNFYPSGVSDTSDPKWKSVYEATYGSLSLPIYPSLGNHDHLGNIWAQVDYSKMHSRWNMPAPYYGIVQPLDSQTSLLLLAIDTDVLRQGKDPQQLLWIKDQLQNTKAHWKIVYGHHPIYSSGAHGENEYLKAHLDPILVETKTDLYIAGHDHTLEIIRPNHGVVYAIAGGGGGKERAYPIKKGPHTVYGTTGGGFLDLWVSVKSMRIEAHPLSTPKPAPFTIPKTVPASK
jgi:tartrate-resistant acid phosphatase type 5